MAAEKKNYKTTKKFEWDEKAYAVGDTFVKPAGWVVDDKYKETIIKGRDFKEFTVFAYRREWVDSQRRPVVEDHRALLPVV